MRSIVSEVRHALRVLAKSPGFAVTAVVTLALRAVVQPMQDAVIGDSTTGLWLLMGAVIGFMLIACLNLANAQTRTGTLAAARGCDSRGFGCYQVAAPVEFAGGKLMFSRHGRDGGSSARHGRIAPISRFVPRSVTAAG